MPPINSISVLAWVRAPTAGAYGTSVQGTLTLWQLDKKNSIDIQNLDRPFEIIKHDEWFMIENTLDIQQAQGTYDFRVEFYLTTTEVIMDIDSVMVF